MMIEVQVPATSANCCIGFDCLGMALDWFATFRFTKSNHLEIEGCPQEYQNENNLVVQAFAYACQYLQKEMPTFHLEIDSKIPFERGLGSSATCIVAGVMACDAWFQTHLNKMEMLKIATMIEGHPDNVAPAIFGQAIVSFMQDNQPTMMMIPCQPFHGVAFIPEYPIETEQSRSKLPECIRHDQASLQVAHALAFVQALQIGNEKVLYESCVDYLHEPYRKQQIQEYESLHQYCQDHHLPMWISGSGSTMMVISMELSMILGCVEHMTTLYPNLQYRFVQISKKGASVIYE